MPLKSNLLQRVVLTFSSVLSCFWNADGSGWYLGCASLEPNTVLTLQECKWWQNLLIIQATVMECRIIRDNEVEGTIPSVRGTTTYIFV